MYENWKVIKRDGSIESFISDKIRTAILCPFIACYNELKKKSGQDILEYDLEKNWDEHMQNVYYKQDVKSNAKGFEILAKAAMGGR